MRMGQERSGWVVWILYLLIVIFGLGLILDAKAQTFYEISIPTVSTGHCNSVARHYCAEPYQGAVTSDPPSVLVGGSLSTPLVACSVGAQQRTLIGCSIAFDNCGPAGSVDYNCDMTVGYVTQTGDPGGSTSFGFRVAQVTEDPPEPCPTGVTQGTFWSCSVLPSQGCFSGCLADKVQSGIVPGGTESPCGVGAANHWGTYVTVGGDPQQCDGELIDDPLIGDNSPPEPEPDPDPDPDPPPPTTPFDPAPPPSGPTFPPTDPETEPVERAIYISAEDIIQNIRWHGEHTQLGLAAINANLTGPILHELQGINAGLSQGDGIGQGQAGDGCDAPPICDVPGSDECLLLLQDWEQWCEGDGTGLGDGLGDGEGDSDNPDDLWADLDDLPQSLDQSGFLGPGQCPTSAPINVGTASFVIDYAPVCYVVELLGSLMIAAGAFVSTRIVLGAI